LELALLNLAVNGRDAMPTGGRLIISAVEENITANHRTALKAGKYVCLSVTDNGEGMDEATRERAMEPFFTTKGVGKGTGLGLPMVHGVAEQSGGRLILKSRKGAGTTAELWLPVASQNAEASGRPQLGEDKSESAGRQLVVVAVDDDSLVLINMVAMLEDLGHVVHAANSGKQAIEVIRRAGGVDLVITDQVMPQMTGPQLSEVIRADWPDLPIILATGYAELATGEAIRLPRLAKPFTQRDLAQAVAVLLRPEAEPGRVVRFPSR
jgi:CheY-like chemotaxis protein